MVDDGLSEFNLTRAFVTEQCIALYLQWQYHMKKTIVSMSNLDPRSCFWVKHPVLFIKKTHNRTIFIVYIQYRVLLFSYNLQYIGLFCFRSIVSTLPITGLLNRNPAPSVNICRLHVVRDIAIANAMHIALQWYRHNYIKQFLARLVC